MIKHRTTKVVAALLLILTLGIGLVWGGDYLKLFDGSKEKQARAELLNQGIINVLLLGIDARSGETKARSDSMILASIDTTHKKVGLISIPRDTRVQDGNHYQKINTYNFIGGPELAKQKVEELLGVPVHYYVLTNFSGFKDIIDILGGVTIDVEKRMYKPSEDIDLVPGRQKLDGNQALAYCRYRSDALGDIARVQRQQKFLKAVAAEIMQPSTLSKLPKLVPQIKNCVTTDIPMSQMLKIARAAGQFQKGQSQMVAQALPGWFYNDPVTGASYWVVDETKLPGIVDKVLNGTTIEFIEGTLNGQVASHTQDSSPHQKPAPEATQAVQEPQPPAQSTTDNVIPPADPTIDNNQPAVDNQPPPDTPADSSYDNGNYDRANNPS